MRDNLDQVRTREPHNPGLSVAQFFEDVAGMGKRAQKNGTMARIVRDRKK